jgi:hypothetical protein
MIRRRAEPARSSRFWGQGRRCIRDRVAPGRLGHRRGRRRRRSGIRWHGLCRRSRRARQCSARHRHARSICPHIVPAVSDSARRAHGVRSVSCFLGEFGRSSADHRGRASDDFGTLESKERWPGSGRLRPNSARCWCDARTEWISVKRLAPASPVPGFDGGGREDRPVRTVRSARRSSVLLSCRESRGIFDGTPSRPRWGRSQRKERPDADPAPLDDGGGHITSFD